MADVNNDGKIDDWERRSYTKHAGRKFLLTIMTDILLFGASIFLIYRGESELAYKTFALMVWISVVYCGANLGQDFIEKGGLINGPFTHHK